MSLMLSGIGFLVLTTIMINRIWQQRTLDILRKGQWVIYLVLFTGLSLMFMTKLEISQHLSLNTIHTLALSLMIFFVPQSFLFLENFEVKDQVFIKFVPSLLWLGVFMISVSGVMVAPHGGNLSTIGLDDFSSYFKWVFVGLLFIVLACILILWDKILERALLKVA